MTSHFITAEVDLQKNLVDFQQAIESEIEQHGDPLRWAITAVNEEESKATVEAVVTTSAKS